MSSSSMSNSNSDVVVVVVDATTMCSMEELALSECLKTERSPDVICWGDVPDVLLLDLILGMIQQQQQQAQLVEPDTTTTCDQAQSKTCDLARECEPCQDVTLAYAQCSNVRYCY
jgi:hypothetical protein